MSLSPGSSDLSLTRLDSGRKTNKEPACTPSPLFSFTSITSLSLSFADNLHLPAAGSTSPRTLFTVVSASCSHLRQRRLLTFPSPAASFSGRPTVID
ncbi:hypothetical protein L1887_36536 [Cichorium endivia]|nr:hypothetical protein L1887_36536 [Cichorium endivia]